MRVIVAGSRSFNDYKLLESILLKFDLNELVIVCGECRGADKLGRQFAEEHGLPILSFPANWDKYKKRAGYLRNIEMAENADRLLAFWDGVSPGTKHMIDIAAKKNIKTKVVLFDGKDLCNQT